MKRCTRLAELGRRQFLRGGAAAVGAATAAVVPQGTAHAAAGRISYPSNKLAHIKELRVDEPLDIAYPDDESPGVLVKLGKSVPGGVGPDGDVVAYSVLCPHKGFPLTYNATDKSLNCPGHYSRFDCEMEGQQIWGHANQSLPMFTLRVDEAGDIYAEGVDELIYGRTDNMLA